MERKEGDPLREVTNKLYDFAESIKGDVVVKGGDFHIEKGNLRAEIKVDSLGGKVSYELYDGSEMILSQENTDLETIFDNIEGRAFPDDNVIETTSGAGKEAASVNPVEDLMAATPRIDSDLASAEAPEVPKDLAA
ncbi:hypothetical protein HN358_02340 [Candidatus Uhrbacteria bacterium]|jgi:hypothetical protein|nr:hypothetical protein [Candidatus Uhrbacteria bacterium]MBT7717518.1 hypothetical protein [Candidatus Uhrbacteria bacterium]